MRWRTSSILVILGLSSSLSAQTLIWSRATHAGSVNDLAFSNDGGTLATACEDGSVKLYRFKDGSFVRDLYAHYDPALCLAFSRDGQYLATGGIDRGIDLYRTSDFQRLYRIDTTGFVESLAFSANSQYIEGSLGYSSNDLREFRASDGMLWSITIHHWGTVWSVDCSANGAYMATSGADGRVIVYSEQPYQHYLFDAPSHEDDAIAVRFSPNSSILASAGGYDETVVLTSLPSGSTLRTIDVGFVIYDIAFSRDGSKIAVAGEELFGNGRVKIFDVNSGAALQSIADPNGYRSVAFFPLGNFYAVGREDGVVQLFGTPTGSR